MRFSFARLETFHRLHWRGFDTGRRVLIQARPVCHTMFTASGVRLKVKLETYAMKRVAAGVHHPTPWLFEPAKRPDDRADYCLDCSFLPQWKNRVLVFTFEWSGARPMATVVRVRPNEHSQRTGPPGNAD